MLHFKSLCVKSRWPDQERASNIIVPPTHTVSSVFIKILRGVYGHTDTTVAPILVAL